MDLFWVDSKNPSKIESEFTFKLRVLIDRMKIHRGMNLEKLYLPNVRQWSYAITKVLIKTVPANTEKKSHLKIGMYVPIKAYKNVKGSAPTQIRGKCERYDGVRSELYMESLRYITPGMVVPKPSYLYHKSPVDLRTTILCIGWTGKGDDLFLSRNPVRLVFIAVLHCEWGIVRPGWFGDDPRRGGRDVIKRLLRGVTWVYNPYDLDDEIPRKYVRGVIAEEKIRVCKRAAPTMAEGLPVYPPPKTKKDFEKLSEYDQRLFADYMIQNHLKFCENENCGRIFPAKRSDARACQMSACKKTLSKKIPIRNYKRK
jgi:hypothetical protein